MVILASEQDLLPDIPTFTSSDDYLVLTLGMEKIKYEPISPVAHLL
jgi:hypothetical protein